MTPPLTPPVTPTCAVVALAKMEAVRRRMVTFTRMPYAAGAHRARLQDEIVYGSLAVIVLVIAVLIVRLMTR